MTKDRLYQTTITIWTDYDPRTRGGGMEIDALAEQAMTGDAYCTGQDTMEVLVDRVDEVANEAGPALLEFFDMVDADADSSTTAESNTEMTVRAEFRTDDGRYTFPFDALPYLVQASDADLIELRDTGWTGDYPSDAVGYFMEDLVPAVAEALVYATQHDVGWNVEVNAVDAEAWVSANRPALSGDAAEGDRS